MSRDSSKVFALSLALLALSCGAAPSPPCSEGQDCAAKPPAPPTTAETAPPAGATNEFNRSAAAAALGSAAAEAKKCKQPDGPSGPAKVTVTFEPSGTISSANVLGPPFEGTPTGECVARIFGGIHIPPFSKDAPHVVVTKSFKIP